MLTHTTSFSNDSYRYDDKDEILWTCDDQIIANHSEKDVTNT